MRFPSPEEVDRQRHLTKMMLRSCILNPKEEAARQGVSTSTVYSWMDPNKLLDFPLYRVGFSTAVMGILGYIHRYTHPASFTHNMPDDWATLTELFGQIYKLQREKRYNENLAGIFLKLSEAIIQEWRISCTTP